MATGIPLAGIYLYGNESSLTKNEYSLTNTQLIYTLNKTDGAVAYADADADDDADKNNKKTAEGTFVSIASLQPSDGQRFFFLTRFYRCTPGPLCDPAAEIDEIEPTAHIALVRVDLHHGAVGRLQTPWDGIGSLIPLPPDLQACRPHTYLVKENVAVGGPLMADAATLIVSLMCGGGWDGALLHILALDVSGPHAARTMWATALEGGVGKGGPKVAPGIILPATTAPHLWLDTDSATTTATATATEDVTVVWSVSGERLAALDVLGGGAVLSDNALIDILIVDDERCGVVTEAMTSARLAAPPVATPGKVIIPVVAIDATGASLLTFLAAVSTTNALHPHVMWCVVVSEGFSGSLTIATTTVSAVGGGGGGGGENNTVIVFATGAGTIVGLRCAAC